jgi:O-acetyl-ADP-ribose deacetylase (regulator of RNase III)
MLTILVGDLFASEAQTLVNAVNCVGVMGAGVALEFKKRFPDMYADYVERCRRNQVRMGRPYLFTRESLPWVLNFPTKGHWRSVSRLSDIVEGLDYLERNYEDWGITSLAVPALGCGNGGLEWSIVRPVLAEHLAQFNIPVALYAPHGTPEAHPG